MKATVHIKSFGLGILIGGIATIVIAAATERPVAWDYSVVIQNPAVDAGHPGYIEIRTNEFNGYAKEGWEVVCAQTIPSERVNAAGKEETIRVRETILRRAHR